MRPYALLRCQDGGFLIYGVIQMKWFRLYHEIIDDPKIGMMSFEERWLWIEILCLASISRNGGNTDLTVTETEWKLRRNIKEPLQKLLRNGLVTFHKRNDGEQTICVPKWDVRQFQSDTSTERVKKHREKRFSNGDETFL